MVLNPDKRYFMLFGVRDRPQTDLVSNKVTIKIAKQKKSWESLVVTNLISPRILLAFPKRRI